IGHRLLLEEGNARKYLREAGAMWEVTLDPAKNHFDKQVAVELPFSISKPGAWLIQGEMTDGNSDAIVVWINDTAIVEKPLVDAMLYYVSDAKTGKPLPNVKLDFFMFGSERVSNASSEAQRKHREFVTTDEFAVRTDANGQYILNSKDSVNRGKQWLIQAGMENDKQSQRFAWLGFKSIWFRDGMQDQFNQDKAFVIFDRPVYRPEQKVEYKIWMGKAQYDLPDESQWANKTVWLSIRDPRQTVMEEREITLDDKGGYTGSLELKKDASLGRYQIYVSMSKDRRGYGSGVFCVEEYRKPEYEVLIDAPKDPVALGEKFTAKISARYYFGAPVTEAKVKYTVTRTQHVSFWCPVR
ncbi:MAG: MG2 domain-containing protein, partial [Planctomycetia bacterium]|nr:MG2 domain-containing protein [Planctomycetia bacterium]